MAEQIMVKALNSIKKIVQGYVVDELPKIKGHLKFYLEIDILHKQVYKYLKYSKEEVQQNNMVAGVVKDVIHVIPTKAPKLLREKDPRFVYMDVNACTTKKLSWNMKNEITLLVERPIKVILNNMGTMINHGTILYPQDDQLKFHYVDTYLNFLEIDDLGLTGVLEKLVIP